MTTEIRSHYELIVSGAYTMGLHGGGTAQEYDELVTQPLLVGAQMLAKLRTPTVHHADSHVRLRETFCQAASHVYFFYRPQERSLDSLRYFAEGFGMGFDRGEETYSSTEPPSTDAGVSQNPSIEEMALISAASLLFARGEREYGRVIRAMVRRMRSTGSSQEATQHRGFAQTRTAAPEVAAGWRPIETAPKDGTAILLRSRKGRVADGQWLAATNSVGCWVWAYVNVEPDSWMPLPVGAAAPEVAPQADEREAFEAAYMIGTCSKGDNRKIFRRRDEHWDRPGDYILSEVELCWRGWRLRAAAPEVAPQVARPGIDVDSIMQSICETDPADPEDKANVVCVRLDDLRGILEGAAAPEVAAPAGPRPYPPMPDLCPLWRSINAWEEAEGIAQTCKTSAAVDALLGSMLRDYVDADRAAQAACDTNKGFE